MESPHPDKPTRIGRGRMARPSYELPTDKKD